MAEHAAHAVDIAITLAKALVAVVRHVEGHALMDVHIHVAEIALVHALGIAVDNAPLAMGVQIAEAATERVRLDVTVAVMQAYTRTFNC